MVETVAIRIEDVVIAIIIHGSEDGHITYYVDYWFGREYYEGHVFYYEPQTSCGGT